MMNIDINFLATDLIVDIQVEPQEGLFDEGEWQRAIAAQMPDIARETRDFWYSEAGRRLKTSRQEYQDAIMLESVTDTGFVISLNGDFLPSAVELGTSKFDMKPGFYGKIIPLNVNRDVNFIPKVFRAVSLKGSGVNNWIHPGFTAAMIQDDVLEELDENIIPKYMDRAIDSI